MISVSRTEHRSLARVQEARQILADDGLIEALRSGEIGTDHDDPLVRILARWRMSVLAGT
ncbi:hypothetical protein ACVGVM_15965 [Pseudonocardia bannensis]|uniref:Uncharacterized protein n=1 Tax=Pseudonocardia bannensis TaxID=630973 RepID=A0A848DEJ3_9PSEU|nr:hypothetical protein [Pseudonocardia bannensis]NMH91009.1 hypothetical protein [Pseudonocardia bannensis]